MSRHPPLSSLRLAGIYVLLLMLLAATVFLAHLPLGSVSLIVALAIAAGKAALVMLYFMHVRFASRVTWLFAAAGILWLSILFSLTFAEYAGRSGLSRASPLPAAINNQADMPKAATP